MGGVGGGGGGGGGRSYPLIEALDTIVDSKYGNASMNHKGPDQTAWIFNLI